MARSIDIWSTARKNDAVIVVGTLTAYESGSYGGSVTVAVPDQLTREEPCQVFKDGGSWLIYIGDQLVGNASTLQTAAHALGNELQARAEARANIAARELQAAVADCPARTIARATGSVSGKHTEDVRNDDGTITVTAEHVWSRTAPCPTCEAKLRACDACNAEAGETCRPGCIGEAGELEKTTEAELEAQEGREAVVQAAVVVRAQLLSQPLLSEHLRTALETLVGYAEELGES